MKSVLITGCSSGFGRATALHLARRGWRVFATVRRADDQRQLLAEGSGLALDVRLCDLTDEAQRSAVGSAVTEALQGAGGLDALINNAGTAFPGPLELLPLADLRAQFEVNVVAHVAMTQALMPLLKAARGTIVNVSSVGGRIAFPITSAYHASKFALEALSDSLRIELAPFGVKVVVVEPGGSPTAIWATGERHAGSLPSDPRAAPYAPLIERYLRLAHASARRGFPPEHFAWLVERILAAPHPRPRYTLGRNAGYMLAARRLLPDWAWDRIVRRTFRW